jgi:hypothetical protein
MATLGDRQITTKKTKRTPKPDPETQSEIRVTPGLVDAVIEISKQRARTMGEMKNALEAGDDETALEKARELTGLPSKKGKSK